MNILFVITGLAVGGAEIQAANLADELSRRGHRITLAYMLQPVLVRPESDEVQVVWLGGTKSVAGMVRACINLARLIGKTRPDVVHSHMFHANILCRSVRLIAKIPFLICSAHNTNEGGHLRMLAYRMTDRLAHVFTNVSEEAVASFEQKNAAPMGRILAVYNGVDTERFSFDAVARNHLRATLKIGDCKVFIAVGRLHRQKNYPNLLTAFADVHAQHDDTHLLIVGDGELRPGIEQQIAELGLQQAVTLLGIREDVPALLSAADVFVLSSAWEGFPLAVAEAMSAERLVVATNAGGVAEALGGEGYLVEPGNTPALVVGMLNALGFGEKDAYELGKSARQRIQRLYGLQRTADCWERIYIESPQIAEPPWA